MSKGIGRDDSVDRIMSTGIIAEIKWVVDDLEGLMKDAGLDPSKENVRKVLGFVSEDGFKDCGGMLLADRSIEEGWEIMQFIYGDAIESVKKEALK